MTMGVRDVLEQQGSQLLDIDLEVLEEELRTGPYDAAYVRHCQSQIDALRASRATQASSAAARPAEEKAAASASAPTPNPSGAPLSPFNGTEKQPAVSHRSQFGKALLAIRAAGSSVTAFRKLVSACPYANEQFIDENIDLFNSDELKALLKMKPFSEAFLEKYFSSLDHETLARTQEFSEEFFIAHYGDLDPQIVLTRGVNEWKDKAKRSTKLDVFLRVKGVRL